MSDADGDCSWIIPDTQIGGANRNRQFWVVQTGVPRRLAAELGSLVTGPDGGPFGPTPYQFRTGTTLVAGEHLQLWNHVHARHRQHRADRIRRDLAEHQANPVAPTKCGLDVALILDVSGSVSGSLPALKLAATAFTNSLVGTPSQLALFTFAATAPAPGANNQNRPLTPVSTQAGADTVNAWINGVTAGGTTNWDRGLFQVQQSTAQFDIAVIITDGNPTVYGNTEGPGNYTRFREVENGIFSANAVKAEGTRMLAFGVGAGHQRRGGEPGRHLRAHRQLGLLPDQRLRAGRRDPADPRAGHLHRLGHRRSSRLSRTRRRTGSITGAPPARWWTFGADDRDRRA